MGVSARARGYSCIFISLNPSLVCNAAFACCQRVSAMQPLPAAAPQRPGARRWCQAWRSASAPTSSCARRWTCRPMLGWSGSTGAALSSVTLRYL